VIAGHFGFAAVVKSRAPRAPLWALMLASVWMDVIFVPLFAAGIEPIEKLPGTSGGYGEGIIHADYTHSLVGALVIAVTFGLVCALRWRREVALVLGVVVFSHWVLDLPMHHADMPLLPGNAGHLPKLGFGLWSYPRVSEWFELGLVLLGAYLYALEAASVGGVRLKSHVKATSLALLAGGIGVLALNVAGQ
jgi:hypothetical protein